MKFTESIVEDAALAWLAELGYTVLHGPEIAPGEPFAERDDYGQVVLAARLRQALQRLNPTIPPAALDEAFRRLTRPDSPSLVANNHTLHRYLVDGVPVEVQQPDASFRGDLIRVLDHADPANNEFLAINQFTVVEDRRERRPDVVLFVNGLPLAIIELKNPADEAADLWRAHNQLQTYKQQIPALFVYNALLVISDGVKARIGTLTADREWFLPWRTITGETLAPVSLPELQVMLQGVFDKRRFLDLVAHFILFEDVGGGTPVKKMAGYHQYHAVNTAVAETVRACAPDDQFTGIKETGTYLVQPLRDAQPGDRRVGVVWHTQGAGKSLSMVFYAGRIVLHPAMQNPTLVVITDRNDLDDQLFGTFSRCSELLRQSPVQAHSRAHLRDLLRTRSGGVIFTTVHKFFPGADEDHFPLLSDRRNIVVIADEAHRSQYDFIDGFARHMRDALPNASFIAFTGTPIELADRNTRAVFGDYISIYDIQQAVHDGATVPIYYEGRLAKLALDENERPKVDPDFDEVTEGEELEQKERLKTKWAQLEAIVGAEKRVALVAQDLVEHFEHRLEAMDGKAMVVAMSRRICIDLYNAIVALRPAWRDDGSLKIVMTGSATDPPDWQPHIRTKAAREELARRFKDPKDPFRIVIVRDMWLTGFDAPCLHTMYIDKPMRSHGLMQAIARVNRVFKDKPGGLVVDYLGLANELREALAVYTESGGQGKTAIDQEEAVAAMMEKYEICRGLFHGFDWAAWIAGPATTRLTLLPAAQEHILRQDDGKRRLVEAVTALSKAFALAVPHDQALAIRDDVAFFQAVKSVLAKRAPGEGYAPDELDYAIRQIVSRAVASDEVVDIFTAAGLKKPDISTLSEEFLAEVRGMPQRHLAVETLRKLLEGEIKTRRQKNIVQARSFAEMLEQTIRRYQNRAIEAIAVIEEMITLARTMREADRRGERLGLTEEEIAFYDALEVNDSAVKILGDDVLRAIAQELVQAVRNSVTIDWTMRENVRAKIRVMIRRILRRHGYPPDKQEKATQTVLEQAEVLCKLWVGG
ncbi:MAG: type I restriction endonuclease subunit R [Anaerolineae bacterium]